MKERTKEELLELRSMILCQQDREIIDQLLAEMDKPRLPAIDWESRPWATEVRIAYANDSMSGNQVGDRIATIKRPVTKTRAREIAEEVTAMWQRCDPSLSGMSHADTIEAAIMRREKELEAGR